MAKHLGLKDPYPLKITFVFYDDDWRTPNRFPLAVSMKHEMSPQQLMMIIDYQCIIHRDPGGELFKYATYREDEGGFDTTARVGFKDFRPKYLNSRQTMTRFENVRDMMISLAEEKFDVTVDVCKTETDETQPDLVARRPEYVYHRIATLPVVEVQDSEPQETTAGGNAVPEQDSATGQKLTTEQILNAAQKLTINQSSSTDQKSTVEQKPATDQQSPAPGPKPKPPSQEFPLTYALLQRFTPDSQNFHFVKVPSRQMFGHSIGSCDTAQDVPVETSSDWDELLYSMPKECRVPPYQSLSDVFLRVVLQDNTRLSLDTFNDGVPVLPHMTFLPYERKLDLKNMPKGEIWLAVTMIDQLHSQDVFPETLALPADVWVYCTEEGGTIGEIRRNLKQALKRFGREQKIPEIEGLFEDATLWWLDLWILPEVKDESQLGKLRMMKEDDVVNMFLDPSLKHEDATVMYMEAHLVPNRK